MIKKKQTKIAAVGRALPKILFQCIAFRVVANGIVYSVDTLVLISKNLSIWRQRESQKSGQILQRK